jgi:acetyl-CoA carboxylase biotin carboxylase subunit
MFSKVLVANRSEIALRVVRALKDLGVTSVVAYSTADKDTLAVKEADQAVCIGPAPSAKSYLDPVRLIGAATSTGCEAVHPGYGFLSESAEFARLCKDNGLVFIGPDAEVIERMGDKANAKATMKAAGVPCVPGSDGEIDTVEEAQAFADSIGYPVLIKASAGGGGKGMREVHAPEELKSQYEAARAEARNAFGNDGVYIEKLIQRPRHIEVQVLADEFGHAAALCERDCSVQRRHQKLVEEAPSPALDQDLRRRMCETAVKAVRGVGYTNAGTIEFLLDTDGSYYFMEMNTRIQVEHGVTEQITLTDLVCEQLRIAAHEPMTVPDGGIDTPVGHCFEFRINAEDPARGFMPCPGTITKLILPGGPGVRVDTGVYEGYTIPPTYDSLVAKLMVWGPTREIALARSVRALEEFVIEGIKTTVPFHLSCIGHPEFKAGNVYTDFIDVNLSEYSV